MRSFTPDKNSMMQAGGRFIFHDTPTPASRIDQIELFFIIVHRQSLRLGDFHSVAELRVALLGQ